MSKISKIEALFISLGGQAPFVSFFIFGGYVSYLLGPSSAFAILIAGIIVLLNGLVLNELSKRFPYYGGYYVYSYYTLTSSISVTTFWTYLLFNTTYAMAYLFGTSYMLDRLVLHHQDFSFLLSLSIIILIYLAGRKPTAKYAIFAGSLELGIMFFLGIYLWSMANFEIQNPIKVSENFAQGILFATGIPTGFIVLASLAGEVEESRKVVGKMMLLVILIGTFLSAFDFYALSLLGIPLVEAIEIGLGILLLPIVIFTVINDGFLGVLAYILSTIGLLKAFRHYKIEILSDKSNIISLLIFVIFPSILYLYIKDSFSLFVYTSFLSLMSNFFINSIACAVSLRLGVSRFMKKRKWVYLVSLSLLSLFLNLAILIMNIESGPPNLVYIFLAWIIIGFFLSSILEIIKVVEKEYKE